MLIVRVVAVVLSILTMNTYADDAQVVVQQNASNQNANAVGGSIIQNKLDQKFGTFRDRVEEKLAKALDNINVSVEDKETIVATSTIETESGTIRNRVRVFPIIGWTSISSDYYDVSSQYSIGLGVEADLSNTMAMGFSYMYTKYDIRLANANPYYYNVVSPYGLNSNLTTLQYNQNLFDVFAKYNFMPVGAKFRPYVGAGTGISKGYLNYKQNSYVPQQQPSYYGATSTNEDYEITAWTGSLLAGTDINISSSISIGVDFRYYKVLSASENRPINNYGFINSGYGYSSNGFDKEVVGGTLKSEDFYSIAGAVKVSF